METNGLPGGMFSGVGSGILGLEMPLHPQPQPQQQPQNPQSVQNPHGFHQQQHHPQMVAYSHHENDHSQHLKQGYPFGSKTKQTSTLSDDDESGSTPDDGGGKRKGSPWQRMKWTDGMVRLLIMAVYYIGDEAGPEGGGGNDPSGKKKGVGAGGLLQKKGKWKSVSRAMMEKGFYVSPQQCEDKFNDLNKRYKRVNDILGRGTACKVVENQSLLDSMDLSPNIKEEVRKLLNSKHLFFREMCAYHNSCGHASTSNHSPELETKTSQIHPQQAQHKCLHSSDDTRIGGNSGRTKAEESKLSKVVGSEEDDDDDDEEEEDESDGDGDDDNDDEEAMDGHSRGLNGHGDDEERDEKSSLKRPRNGAVSMSLSPLMQQLNNEVTSVIQDGSKSAWEKKHWMKMRAMQLEEQQVSYQCQAFELEKQRLKWVKFSGKKEREMEKAKLENERRRLENERMALIVRQKELEMEDIQHYNQPQKHSSNRRGDPSSITG
ncbi:hypothetical protein HRI_001763100 [Hibiscus trionum]|uniref:Myb/SANT-like DNA-binding domain-containing protein n=1 Tax=Hibiscus trionum TaxID=183268 RepID=A0A9W7HP33_HIBTR|nr:hypothetical protein HRI_001763100 [Hibiscus trionum]